jgi:hypothetical protein
VLQLEENSPVADDVFVLKLFDVDEILPQEKDVFGIEHASLYCQHLSGLLAEALLDDAMCSFPDLLSHHVHVVEHASLKGIGLVFTLRVCQFFVEEWLEACTFFSETSSFDLVLHG